MKLLITFLVIYLTFISLSTCLISDPCLVPYKGKFKYGGKLQVNLETENSCYVKCLKDKDCGAFEWTSETNECFFFTDKTIPTYNSSQIIHYIYKCECQWTVYDDKQQFGGVEKKELITYEDEKKKSVNITSLELCKEACEKINCAAIDWKVENPLGKCFIHFSSKTLYEARGIIHLTYKCGLKTTPSIVPIGVSPTYAPNCYWLEDRNRKSKSGNFKKVKTLEDCKTMCLVEGCFYGFDWMPFNNDQNRCFVSQSNILLSLRNSHHYSQHCSPNSNEVVWEKKKNFSSAGGSLHSEAFTLEECKDACISRSPCSFGFDWDSLAPLGQQCWFSTTSNLESNVHPSVDHYNFKPGPLRAPTVPESCIWTEHSNTLSPGGSSQPLYSTLEDCKAYCFAQTLSKCAGIDWNSKEGTFKCWFSVPGTPLIKGDFPGITHYSYSCSATTTSVSSESITEIPQEGCNYVAYYNKSAKDGVPQPNIINELDCKNLCTISSTCKAFQWREKDATKCLFHSTTPQPNFLISDNESNLYIYVPC